MKKQLLIPEIAFLLICVGLSGCLEESNETIVTRAKIIGIWYQEDEGEWEFKANGSLLRDYGYGLWEEKWEMNNSYIFITFIDGAIINYSYKLLNDDTTLILESNQYNESYTLTRGQYE